MRFRYNFKPLHGNTPYLTLLSLNIEKGPVASYDMFQQHPMKSPGFMDFMMDDVDDASQEDDFTTEYEEIQDGTTMIIGSIQ